jgi:integrase
LQVQDTSVKKRADKLSVALIVRPNTKREPVWSAVWRDSTKTRCMKTVGPAHLRARPPRKNPFKPEAGGREVTHESKTAAGWTLNWERKPGRAPEGRFDERAAMVRARELVLAREVELEREQREATGAPTRFDALVAEWLTEREAEVKDGTLKASTFRDYVSMAQRPDAATRNRGRGRDRAGHLMRAFATREVDSITADDLESFQRKLQSAGLSVATRRKYGVLVKMLMDYGVHRGVIDRNPVLTQRKRRGRKQEQEITVLTMEWVAKVAARADALATQRLTKTKRKSADGLVGTMILVSAYTGLRQGELIALTWGDLDFTKRSIRVTKTYGARDGLDVPKSGTGRVVPLSDQAAALLDGLSRRDSFTGRTDLVFPNLRGEHIDDSWLRRKWTVARDAVIADAASEGEALPEARWHDLRHTYGTRCATRGVSMFTLKNWMGHSDVATTMRYSHWSPQTNDAEELTRAFTDDTPADAELLAEVG